MQRISEAELKRSAYFRFGSKFNITAIMLSFILGFLGRFSALEAHSGAAGS